MQWRTYLSPGNMVVCENTSPVTYKDCESYCNTKYKILHMITFFAKCFMQETWSCIIQYIKMTKAMDNTHLRFVRNYQFSIKKLYLHVQIIEYFAILKRTYLQMKWYEIQYINSIILIYTGFTSIFVMVTRIRVTILNKIIIIIEFQCVLFNYIFLSYSIFIA